MNRNKVVLVDENDQVLGEMDKMEAHVKGALHKAFSIFLFNDKGETLIHQRAAHKYHGANLWTNTCCSHPQWDEDVKLSALERLQHEMGMVCDIEFQFSFLYQAEVENDLIEHELDHVFIGNSNDDPKINPDEVQDYKWISLLDLKKDIENNPLKYTFWFKKALPVLLEKMVKISD